MKICLLALVLTGFLCAPAVSAEESEDRHVCDVELVVKLGQICYAIEPTPMQFEDARLHCVGFYDAGDLATLVAERQAKRLRKYLGLQIPRFAKKIANWDDDNPAGLSIENVTALLAQDDPDPRNDTSEDLGHSWETTEEVEEIMNRSTNMTALLELLRRSGVWVGAYRSDSDVQEILSLIRQSPKSDVFSWFHDSSYLLLNAGKSQNCVYSSPKAGYRLKPSVCSAFRLPLCQLHRCPEDICGNGGYCMQGKCLCPYRTSGSTCHHVQSMPRPMAIQMKDIPTEHPADDVPGLDPGLRNLFIALFITVGGSLLIVLIFSKERILSAVRGGSDALREEEGVGVEEVALGPTAVEGGSTSRRAATKPEDGNADATGNAASAVASSSIDPIPAAASTMLATGTASASGRASGRAAVCEEEETDSKNLVDVCISA